MTRRHIRHHGLPHRPPIILDPPRLEPMPTPRVWWPDALGYLIAVALAVGLVMLVVRA